MALIEKAKPFGKTIINLGSYTGSTANITCDVSTYAGYTNFDTSNFLLACTSFVGKVPPAPNSRGTYTTTPILEYDNTIGIITIRKTRVAQTNGSYGDSQYQSINFDLYLIY